MRCRAQDMKKSVMRVQDQKEASASYCTTFLAGCLTPI